MGVIRYLANENGDLYVLEESENWSIIQYPRGLELINDCKKARFGDIQLSLGGSNFGLEASILRESMSLGAKVTEANPNQTKHFCTKFIDDIFLKSDLETDWLNFVYERAQGIEVANARDEEALLLNENIVAMIKDDPYRLGIPGGTPFDEVNFSNRLSSLFRYHEHFKSYIQSGIEPDTVNCWGVTRPDLIFVDANHSFILENKFGKRRNGPCRLHTQQMLAGQYTRHNFDEPFTLVGVNVRQLESGRIRLGYHHKTLDSEGMLKSAEMQWDDITEALKRAKEAQAISSQNQI